jgi:hypothetical protein
MGRVRRRASLKLELWRRGRSSVRVYLLDWISFAPVELDYFTSCVTHFVRGRMGVAAALKLEYACNDFGALHSQLTNIS